MVATIAGLFRDEFARFAVKSRHLVSADTAIIRAALPMLPGSWGEDFVPIHRFPPSFCVLAARDSKHGPFKFKPYTPIDWSSNHLDLLVKGYQCGSVSRCLFASLPGDQILIQGPREKFQFSRLNGYKKVLALAGGTGIAPIYQVLKHLFVKRGEGGGENGHLILDFRLLIGNRTRNDILLSSELDSLMRDHEALSIDHLIEEERGFIESQDIPEATSDTFVLVCGPKGFNETCSKILSQKLYKPEQIYQF